MESKLKLITNSLLLLLLFLSFVQVINFIWERDLRLNKQQYLGENQKQCRWLPDDGISICVKKKKKKNFFLNDTFRNSLISSSFFLLFLFLFFFFFLLFFFSFSFFFLVFVSFFFFFFVMTDLSDIRHFRLATTNKIEHQSVNP